MKKISINEFYEIISEPIMLKEKERKTVQHSELPEVDDELSVSLRMRLKSHHSGWATVFRKVKFNDAPLHIGWFGGEIGNFRYFNWRLSAEEVTKNCLVGYIHTITHEFHEIISEPIMLKERKTVQHAELPEVDNELSVSLRIRLNSHHSGWPVVFRKGASDEEEGLNMRTPGLYLHANNSKLHPRFTGNWKGNAGIDAIGDGLLLNK
ncbi:hypothetical protein RhiirA5_479228, partial [Rhizophagus irregularis]